MTCTCGGSMEVKLIESVAICQCSLCDHGKFLPHLAQNVDFGYRARVMEALDVQWVY